MDQRADPTPDPTAVPWGGVVLTGGGAARLGGVDKSALTVDGVTLLERALAALVDAPKIVVVGPAKGTSRSVRFAREDPPGGGPAAGLLAGIAAFVNRPVLVLALAVDMPNVTRATVGRLVAAARDDGAVLVDGRRQHLCAAYRSDALLRAAPAAEDRHGLPMHRLVADLRLVEVAAEGGEARDVDTWEDLRVLNEPGDDAGGRSPLRHGGLTGQV